MIYRFVFGCRHRKLTRPITPHHRPGTKAGPTYVACLDCGKQFHYDVANMRVGKQIVRADANPSLFQTAN